jgi:hypothetical protein
MKNFDEWAKHYGYGHEHTPEALTDYARYRIELRVQGGKSSALQELSRATGLIGEMEDILRDDDGIVSFVEAYAEAQYALTQALQHAQRASALGVDRSYTARAAEEDKP